jgi:hypothetical protein
MFRIDVLPAQRGDCLWITYGPEGSPHHVLVDAGPQETISTVVPELEQRIARLRDADERVELLVVSHIDADHIQGVVSLLSVPSRVNHFGDIWFNGWKHHQPWTEEFLGGPDAERLTRLLGSARWNDAFDGGPVAVPSEGPLPEPVPLPGGLEITLLGPTEGALAALAPSYAKECAKAGITPGKGASIAKASWRRDGSVFLGRQAPPTRFDPDSLALTRTTSDPSKANGASITLIAKYGNRRVLLLADAPARSTAAALARLGAGPHEFDAVKVSHHGSRNNTSNALLSLVRSRKWLISTNGAVFGHPDLECLGRIVASQPRKPTFYLNYAAEHPKVEHLKPFLAGAGDRYAVRLPRARRDGSREEGISVSI